MKNLLLSFFLVGCAPAPTLEPKVPTVYVPGSDIIYPEYSEKLFEKMREREDRERPPKPQPKLNQDSDLSVSEYLMLHWRNNQ